MSTHRLKTWPTFYDALRTERKKFEIRKDDRNFEMGDTLVLCEWDPLLQEYTGSEMTVTVTYLLRGLGLKPGYVAMGILFPLDAAPRGAVD